MLWLPEKLQISNESVFLAWLLSNKADKLFKKKCFTDSFERKNCEGFIYSNRTVTAALTV